MKRNDLIIIVVGLLIALAVYGGLQLNNRRFDAAEKVLDVYIDGVLEASFSLEKDGVYRYETDLGYNVVEISGGEASVIEADCPTQSCIYDGSVSDVNASVVCLPNHFHITVTGTEEVEVDAVSQ